MLPANMRQVWLPTRMCVAVIVAAACAASAPGCGKKRGGATPVAPPPATEPLPELATTGAATALSRVTSDPLTEEWPSLSPDHSTLLFHTITVDPTTGTDQKGIVGVDPNTGGRRTLFTGPQSSSGFPSWLPDGSSFVYTTDGMGTPAIVRALSSAPNSGIAVAVSGSAAPDPAQPSVSPDGKRIAFRTFMSGRDQIAVAGLDGSNLTILGDGTAPQWHPDGTKLVFSRRVGEFMQLFTIEADTGTGLTQLTNDPSNNEFPCWSPDGRHVAFASNRTGTLGLFTVRPDGTVVTALTEGTKNATNPHWGGDGYIYFTTDAGGGWDIWRFKPTDELAVGGDVAAPDEPTTPGEPTATPPGPGPAPPVGPGCTKDNDCKGNRICVKSDCVDP